MNLKNMYCQLEITKTIIKEIIYQFLIVFFSKFPIKKKQIFFLSYYGSQYGCNPKYLSEYMAKKCKDWTIVWGFVDPSIHQVPGIKKVKYLSLRYFYELCTSRVFVTNYRMTEHYRKRKGQLYVQTWHSSLRLKKIEGDIEYNLPAHYVEMAKRDSCQTDVLLSGCQFSTDIFKRAFWYSGTIAPTGTPREDMMFSSNQELGNEIKARLGVPREQKILLYAPTFRKDNSLNSYNIDYNRLLSSLVTKFGGDWMVLLRLHPHLMSYSKSLIANNPVLLDATTYDDIQELLFVSDIVISDYSSLIFDYALTCRPCFLYASDLDTYVKNDRSLYFKIEDLPFPICQNNDELNLAIHNFDTEKYQQKVSLFLKTVGSYETGHSCENVVNNILEKIE